MRSACARCVVGVVLALLPTVTGCSQKLSGGPEAGVDIARYRVYHVVQNEKADVATALQQDLYARGNTVTYGPEANTPPAAEAKVMYHDKWMWDMTMYLIEVKIEMVDARSGALLASGRSYRTSLARKPVDVMVKEVMDRIFNTTPVKGERVASSGRPHASASATLIPPGLPTTTSAARR